MQKLKYAFWSKKHFFFIFPALVIALVAGILTYSSQADNHTTVAAQALTNISVQPLPDDSTNVFNAARAKTGVAKGVNMPKSGSPTSGTSKVLSSSGSGAPDATVTASQGAAPTVSNRQALYANPTSNVASQGRNWSATHPSDSAVINRLAATPMANWFGDWNGDIQAATNSYVSAATSAGQVAVLVAYNIPERDCGSYSSGGAASASAYQAWIRSFAVGIGQRTAIVIVEPDALAGMDCLNSTDQQNRLQLLSYAVTTLRSQTRAAIYLDAGNPTWQSITTISARLRAANVAAATGFSLNVSNFQTTASNISYGTALATNLGGKHFVIDTSRNGNGPASGADAWCNPSGRAFGNLPTLQTGATDVDAYLWIKNPGESDGSCGAVEGGTTAPAAGVWWPQYALMLAANSGW